MSYSVVTRSVELTCDLCGFYAEHITNKGETFNFHALGWSHWAPPSAKFPLNEQLICPFCAKALNTAMNERVKKDAG